MDKIRVLFANHPIMVPNAIRQLVEEREDMELVGDCRGPMKILQETGRTKADTVILAQEGTSESGLCSQLLAVYPDLTIVSVTSDLRIVFTEQLCSNRRYQEAAECEDVVKALRRVTRTPCEKEKK